jgi:hypothetical protein
MKTIRIFVGLFIAVITLNSCMESKVSLEGTTWVSTGNSFNSLYMVSFINDKVAYVIEEEDDAYINLLNTVFTVIEGAIEHDTRYYENLVSKLIAYIDSYDPYYGFRGKYTPDPYTSFDYSIDWDSSGYPIYETINVGTHTIAGKKDNKEWRFTYIMENDSITLDLPIELNPHNKGTQFSRRIVGYNVSQPIGIWTNDSGDFFFFTNPDTIKRWGMGTYVSWDYTFDDEYITWSGNKDSGKKPYSIDSKTQQIRLILPGHITATTLNLASSKFVIMF